MKTISVLAFVCLFNITANVYSQNMRLNIEVQETTIRNIFKLIEDQSEYRFFFNDGFSDLNKKVTLDARNAKIEDLLRLMLNELEVSYKVLENNLIVIAPAAELKKQGITITGTVTETIGPMPGVNVTVKGTMTGVVTDSNGRYSVTVPDENAILVFSFVGYLTFETPVGNQRVIDIIMDEDTKLIEEVVVVGYGTQRAKDVTTSVANISMKNINDMPVTGLDQALTGQVAGVMINTSNGIPGGGPQIQIRGLGAVGADSQPLYVIDGFPLPATSSQKSNPINDIPPQDIASITILKDASATAIYGSRGANGVILVTTHKGRSGKPRVQLSAYTGLQQVINKEKPDMMNAREFARFQKERISDQILFKTGIPATDDQIPEVYRDPEALGEGTNWFEEITRVAPINEINLSISGGNDKVTSYISAGYLNQDGVVLNTNFQRFSARANVDAQLGKRLHLGLNMAPTFTTKTRDVAGGDGRSTEIGWAMTANPIPPVYLEDGSYNTMIGDGTSWSYPNLVQSLKEIEQHTKGQRFIGSIFGEYEIISGLKFKTSFNVDWNGSNYTSYKPSIIGDTNNPPPTVPFSKYVQSSYMNWATENTLMYQKEIGEHSFNGLLGYTFQKQTNDKGDFTGNDYTADEVETMNAAARIGEWSTSLEDWALISYIARINYNFRQRYLITATIRRDGSSRFGQDNRWGTFPSASLGWRLSEESFLKDVNWLSDLKLRTSYGLAGNFAIGNYTYMSQITSANYVLGGGLAGGRRMNTLGNPNLGWERVYEWNIGLDYGMFNDRIFLLVDFYRRNTKDLLLDVEIPASSGYTSAKENKGDLQNTGLEISLSTRNISRANFMWTTAANIAFNKNKVVALGRNNADILSGFSGEQNATHITRVGQPLGMFYGYVIEGVYQSWDEVNRGPAYPDAIPGSIKVKDVDGSGNINPVSDFDIIGNPYPDFTWGMTNVLTYKRWDLRIQMTGSVGGHLLKTSYEYTHNTDGIFNVSRDIANRWRSPEQPGDGRTPTTNGEARGRTMYRDVNSDWVKNNDYLWIKNITLGYNLEKGIGSFISGARVYFSVQNAFLLTGYEGNPEVTNYGNSGKKSGTLVPGVEYTTYPVPRVFTLGVNLSF